MAPKRWSAPVFSTYMSSLYITAPTRWSAACLLLPTCRLFRSALIRSRHQRDGRPLPALPACRLFGCAYLREQDPVLQQSEAIRAVVLADSPYLLHRLCPPSPPSARSRPARVQRKAVFRRRKGRFSEREKPVSGGMWSSVCSAVEHRNKRRCFGEEKAPVSIERGKPCCRGTLDPLVPCPLRYNLRRRSPQNLCVEVHATLKEKRPAYPCSLQWHVEQRVQRPRCFTEQRHVCTRPYFGEQRRAAF